MKTQPLKVCSALYYSLIFTGLIVALWPKTVNATNNKCDQKPLNSTISSFYHDFSASLHNVNNDDTVFIVDNIKMLVKKYGGLTGDESLLNKLLATEQCAATISDDFRFLLQLTGDMASYKKDIKLHFQAAYDAALEFPNASKLYPLLTALYLTKIEEHHPYFAAAWLANMPDIYRDTMLNRRYAEELFKTTFKIIKHYGADFRDDVLTSITQTEIALSKQNLSDDLKFYTYLLPLLHSLVNEQWVLVERTFYEMKLRARRIEHVEFVSAQILRESFMPCKLSSQFASALLMTMLSQPFDGDMHRFAHTAEQLKKNIVDKAIRTSLISDLRRHIRLKGDSKNRVKIESLIFEMEALSISDILSCQ